MNLLTLSWKNLINKPLSLLLSLLLFALGVGLISLLYLLDAQMQDKFQKNLAGIDLVVGAKGSPLQLILSSMYHIDNPTGNVDIKAVKPFLNPKHPIIEKAIPLSLGDSYKGYRIVGTVPDYVTGIYNGEIAEGQLWDKDMEVTAGAIAAKELGLELGDRFYSAHGLSEEMLTVHDEGEGFVVTGILKPSGSVIDQLLLTNTESIWKVHDHEMGHAEDHEEHEHSEHEHDHGDHEDHEHEHGEEGNIESTKDEVGSANQQLSPSGGGARRAGEDKSHQPPATSPIERLLQADDQQITSLLIRFKNKKSIPALNFPRNINENTDMQAASPAYERNRLYQMMGTGEQALRILAIAIVIVSGLSIFISLFNSLKDRKYELALMRVMGASRSYLFLLIIFEGLLIALLGYLVGTFIGHGGMEVLSGYMKNAYRYNFTGMQFVPKEAFLLIGALLVGLIAALLPAFQASKTDISQVLTDN